MVLVIGQQGVLSQSVEQLLAQAKATESIENLLEDAVVEKGCNIVRPQIISSPFTMSGFGTGNFFEEWNEITPQIHFRKFEEQMG